MVDLLSGLRGLRYWSERGNLRPQQMNAACFLQAPLFVTLLGVILAAFRWGLSGQPSPLTMCFLLVMVPYGNVHPTALLLLPP